MSDPDDERPDPGLEPHFAAFRELTEPGGDVVARLQRRKSKPRRRGPLLVGGTLVAAAAAGVIFWAVVRTDPPEETLRVEWEGGGQAELGPFVQIQAEGFGEASGTGRQLELAWKTGMLDVAVEPGRGVRLTVSTDEAEVKVVGTRFQVERGPLGTTIQVTQGEVDVHCTDGTEVRLQPRASKECPPTSAAGRLGRITALQARGRSQQVVTEATLALADEPPAPIALELGLHQVAAWIALGRTEQARSALDALEATHPQASDRLAAARARLEDR